MVRRIVTDIEGTTTSIAFVTDTLFVHARRALPAFVRTHLGEARVTSALDAARAEAGQPDLSDEAVVALWLRWIDEDRKATSLKAIQGMIWEEGYHAGAYRSHVYPDVPGALARWKARGIGLSVFSSGSVLAQRLLFGHTIEGDLSGLFDGWFDTTTGKKADPASYARIAAALDAPPHEVLFLSDVKAELDAARAAGLLRVGLARDGASPFADHPTARSFDDIVIEGDAVLVR
ncbi:acireductone synthase [Polyangium jinanense]|uniref:Enolase-phosphatase E1 n=1 Tax=Polyangium jinanense TaxID=2829994 RepID=A0A9X3XC11_9BACT|nr:acireductone synthase [Polyangium jinanense]MDC3957014.1 acireductone synthase [Polyangium jinanense]MDC3986500.1 acireductone synthase [Polyangium jinanense]